MLSEQQVYLFGLMQNSPTGQPWNSMVEGDEGYIGPIGKLWRV